ncbi:MAG: hypothetical protein PHV62_00470 [Sulfuricurvum sp.]|nr:hypothetical protein [Sulfuricurvum sp.]
MKKITLTLLALSTIAFADTLQCKFQEGGKATITLNTNEFYYQGSGCHVGTHGVAPYIGENSIILHGESCNITIKRQTGAIEVSSGGRGYNEVYKGTCTKQMNVL